MKNKNNNINNSEANKYNIKLYNQVNVDDIKFDNIPYKKIRQYISNNVRIEKPVHFINIYYNDLSQLFIQLPKERIVNIDKQNKLLQIEINSDVFINKIEDHIIKNVYNNSVKWFNKKLTIEMIKKSMVSNLNNANGRLILNLILNDEALFFDQYKNKILLDDSCVYGVFIIKIANLQFIDNHFSYCITIEQGKLFKNEQISLIDYSIIDESESGDENELEDEYFSGKNEIGNDDDENFFN